MGQRLLQLTAWVEQNLSHNYGIEGWSGVLESVSGDASFRRYFRARTNGASYIAVDAPPNKEDSHSFVAIAQSWISHGVHVPTVYEYDEHQGFMLLSDLGDDLYWPALVVDGGKNADQLYSQAMDALAHIQTAAVNNDNYSLPPYDQALLQRELDLFSDWFVGDLLGYKVSEQERQLLDSANSWLIENALAQPQVIVHRDYHSRNLMLVSDNNPGVIDFQDAVIGPVTYDLVSLLRDCYIAWPQAQVEQWAWQFAQRLKANGQLLDVSREQFFIWFDGMGMQRHLKAIGIFARLNLRDGKVDYLNDIPRTFNYVLAVSQKHSELKPFHQWLKQRIVPLVRQHELLTNNIEEMENA